MLALFKYLNPRIPQDEEALAGLYNIATTAVTFEHMAVSLSHLVAKGVENPQMVLSQFLDSLPRQQLVPDEDREVDFDRGYLRFD